MTKEYDEALRLWNELQPHIEYEPECYHMAAALCKYIHSHEQSVACVKKRARQFVVEKGLRKFTKEDYLC